MRNKGLKYDELFESLLREALRAAEAKFCPPANPLGLQLLRTLFLNTLDPPI
jgi:hypothetical protein